MSQQTVTNKGKEPDFCIHFSHSTAGVNTDNNRSVVFSPRSLQMNRVTGQTSTPTQSKGALVDEKENGSIHLSEDTGSTTRQRAGVSTWPSSSVTSQFMTGDITWLPLTGIVAPDFRVRVGENPRRSWLTDSLRRRGFQGVLEVVQPPGSHDYQILGGGATRLALLKAMDWTALPCRIVPWQGDAYNLVQQLRQDETEGVSFYEKARTIKHIGLLTGVWGEHRLDELRVVLDAFQYFLSPDDATACWMLADVLPCCVSDQVLHSFTFTEVNWLVRLLRLTGEIVGAGGEETIRSLLQERIGAMKAQNKAAFREQVLVDYVKRVAMHCQESWVSIQWYLKEDGC